FDAVVTAPDGRVTEIQVKQERAATNWIWGAFRMPARTLHELRQLWIERGRADEYIGTLVNAFIARGGEACGVRAGTQYVDVGTLSGYRAAGELLRRIAADGGPGLAAMPAGRRPLAPRRTVDGEPQSP
ncbi:MAG: hypothetical protein J0H99_21425, partial [Rhodospirillales bacterium]|nr:hypothetical protein [Rhodospirillales bacterium]